MLLTVYCKLSGLTFVLDDPAVDPDGGFTPVGTRELAPDIGQDHLQLLHAHLVVEAPDSGVLEV